MNDSKPSPADLWESAHIARSGSGAAVGIIGSYACPLGETTCDAPSIFGRPPKSCAFFGGYEHDKGIVLCRKGSPCEEKSSLDDHMGWPSDESEVA